MQDWINRLFENKEFLRMGHYQRAEDLNLGLGWLYYGIARIIRPQTVVVIGSWRGFVPMVIAKAIQENIEEGKVIFIDPSLADDFWRNEQSVREHFSSFGIDNIKHFLMTTQEFVKSDYYDSLEQVDLLFVDGYHSKEQAQFDYESFAHLISSEGMVLFHDTISTFTARIYGKDKPYEHTVNYFMDELRKRPELEVFEFPFGRGVTVVRKLQKENCLGDRA